MTPVTASNVNGITSDGGNLSSDVESGEPFYLVYFTYIYVGLYVVGLVGNMSSLLVWSCTGKQQRHGTPVVYFRSMCGVDTLVLICHPLEKLNVRLAGACQAIHVLFLAVQVLAVFLGLGLSLQRFIEVVCPLRAGRVVSYGCTVRAIWVQVAMSLLLSSVEGYLWHLDDNNSCELRRVSWMSYYIYTVLIVLFGLPLVSVLLLNVGMMCFLRRGRQNSTAFGGAMVPARLSLTLPVTILCCYMALSELAYAVLHFVLSSASAGSWYSSKLVSLPLLILDVVALTSYAVDVAIFTLSSKTFRYQIKEICALHTLRCQRFRLRRSVPRSSSVYVMNNV